MTDSMQRGIQAARARNGVEAEQWFRRALEESPGDAKAMAWLGQALCSLGRQDEGVPFLFQAGHHLLEVARQSRVLDPVIEIVAQLQHWGAFAKAIELGREIVEIDGTHFRAMQSLAISHAQFNQKPEAVRAGQAALNLAPENLMMQVLQGSLEADAGLHDIARARLEKALESGASGREAFRAHKELARILDKLGEYHQVFVHLHASAALSGALPEYAAQDRDLIPRMLHENTAGYDAGLIRRWDRAEFLSEHPAPVFVLGYLRSGTTLTQEVLDAHPGVYVSDEADFVWDTLRELHRMAPSTESTPEKLRRLDESGIRHLRAFYWGRVRQRFGGVLEGKRFVDKNTMNTIHLGFIHCVFPDAKLIYVERDPRDVCVSCFMQLMTPTPTNVHLLSWERTAGLYAGVMAWWAHIRKIMSLDCYELRYENAIREFEPVYRQVFAFLGLEWDPVVMRFHEHASRKFITTPSRSQVTQPIYTSSIARWRHYASEFVSVNDILKPHIQALGYPPD